MNISVGTPRPSQVIGSVPTISGTPTVGQTLTCDPGQWTGHGITLTYQWVRDENTTIEGETNATYQLAAPDQTHTVKCQVTATSIYGTKTLTSASTEAVA